MRQEEKSQEVENRGLPDVNDRENPDLLAVVRNDLRPGGTLSSSLPGYEERPSQSAMAQIVARAIMGNVPSLIEAPTGTGKGLAYLIPLVRSGKKGIISTSTKILQEELFTKDIAFVRKYLHPNCKVAVIKGSSNYVCLARIEELRQQLARQEPTLRHLLAFLHSDIAEEFTGDIETLPFTLEEDTRNRVQFDGASCSWEHCPYYKDCYVRRMREYSKKADILIINHSLLLLDAVKSGFILPKEERDVVVVIDEAHSIEEEAIRAFTISVTPGQILALLNLRLLQDYSSEEIQAAVRDALDVVWRRLAEIELREPSIQAPLPSAMAEGLLLADHLRALGESLKQGHPMGLSPQNERLYKKLIARTHLLAETIHFIFSADRTNSFVYYLEHTHPGKGIEQICVLAAPLKVSALLKAKLFDAKLTICTSATLSTIESSPSQGRFPFDLSTATTKTEPTFSYFRRTTGWGPRKDGDAYLEYILPSTFHYRDQALLYLPTHLPEPRYEDEMGTVQKGAHEAYIAYIQAMAAEMTRLVLASQGRAFLLFTSKRVMEAIYEIMKDEASLSHLNLLLQGGDQTRKEMLHSFRQKKSILLGLKSFGEGVDIAGEMLSLVVVSKLPFPYPYDPVYEAKRQMMEGAGESWFSQFVLPQVVLRLKQSLGRLIRTSTDQGVMAILDQRMHSRPYGSSILSSLPPAKVTSRYDDVVRFFASIE